ncbi:Hypothetical protein P9303_24151 [Prochlorococcus marinus str. MIT 9303]|uniref:Uncharacterized protein n=2 Tax=Prochlorococcus marinus TaxID=1219 RepID=A2CCD8_PROM3|nr:Hypothetical protein P9303_24151 [Prochlorococcus marinus str. MIT 9303]
MLLVISVMQLNDWMNRLFGRLGKIQEASCGYRFGCPYCGDSQKSQAKARGHVAEKWGKRFFKCHNCGLSKPFEQFLKEMHAELYAEYVNQECPERRLEGAATPFNEKECAKFLALSIYPGVDAMIISLGLDHGDQCLLTCIEERRRDSEIVSNL